MFEHRIKFAKECTLRMDMMHLLVYPYNNPRQYIALIDQMNSWNDVNWVKSYIHLELLRQARRQNHD